MPKRRKTEEEYENPDRWVVSYADFITLLFVFFTAMYAISHVDLGKLERFAGSMQSAFKTSGAVSDKAVIEGINPISYDDIQLEKEVRTVFENFDKTVIEGINISRSERGILISLGDSIMFDTGSAEIKDEAKKMLTAVLSVIKKIQNNIVIEGHTDNIPIKSAEYHSNWELSTARAMSVLMYLMQEDGIRPERFSASGYGEHRPIMSNATPEGRARNRRVDIIIVSKKN